MQRTVTYTHKGWFGLCPVYFADLDGEAPEVGERHALLLPLMLLSEGLFAIVAAITAPLAPAHALGFPLLVTGELVPPLQVVQQLREDAT